MIEYAQLSLSGFYRFEKHQNDKSERDTPAYNLIKSISNKQNNKCGIRTIKMILQSKYGLMMNLKKISRIKKEYGIETSIRKKNKYNIAFKKGLEHRTADNLLKQNFVIKEPNKVYSTDISYLPYYGGKRAFLSATKDLATKEIVAFNVSANLGLETALSGLEKHLTDKDWQDLIIHSDQGFHYTHPLYINKLKEFGIKQSMSRKGNCLDNAPIESFFGHMKDEIELKECKTFEDVKNMIENYMNYYNNERAQWNLNKMTPVKYRRHLLNASL